MVINSDEEEQAINLELNKDKSNNNEPKDNEPIAPKDEQTNNELRSKFNKEMLEYFNKKNNNNNNNDNNKNKKNKNISFEMDHKQYIRKSAINKKQIEYLIDILKNKKTKEDNYYNYERLYYVKKLGDSFELRSILNDKKKVNNPDGDKLVAIEDMWDKCWEIHRGCGYQSWGSMEPHANKKYDNVIREILKIFVKYSQELQQKLVRNKNHGLNIKPIKTKQFMDRWQIDLIDFRTLPDNGYNWICNIQDHFSKFCWLRPLKDKTASEVSKVLNEIISIFGAPIILQSDNGREFKNKLISDLIKSWPDLKIIHGRPRHPQTQGSIERANGDVQNILGSWMRTRQSTKWSQALEYVQLIKNSKEHSRLKCSPYKVVFGIDAPLGIDRLNYDKTIIEKIDNVHDLCKIMGKYY